MTRLLRPLVFLAVFALMWGLLLLVGTTGRVGELEFLMWLGLLVTAEWLAMRWSKQRLTRHKIAAGR